jgi:GMP reductase
MILQKQKTKNMKFDFNDILITPEVISDIRTRSDINTIYTEKSGNYLPIFVAPMDTVVNETNWMKFTNQKLNVCLPRTTNEIDYDFQPNVFVSYSLEEFNTKFIKDLVVPRHKRILIDIANGHMSSLLTTIKKFKNRNPDVELMVGNVANPKTFKHLSNAGADYIRVGIGNGAGCLTTQQTGVGYPMASLVNKCRKLKDKHELSAMIVADGGFKEYSDIIKALALGADYVMLGSIFNKTLESCGPTYWKGIRISNQKMIEWMYNNNFKLTKKFRGMSTKEAQKAMGNKILKTSEGVIRYQPISGRLESWIDNFSHYLKSAMSYTNSRDLSEFIGEVNFEKITTNAYNRFNK